MTPLEAFNALDTSLQWLESQGTGPGHLLLVKKWRDRAARMRQESLKLRSIFRSIVTDDVFLIVVYMYMYNKNLCL